MISVTFLNAKFANVSVMYFPIFIKFLKRRVYEVSRSKTEEYGLWRILCTQIAVMLNTGQTHCAKPLCNKPLQYGYYEQWHQVLNTNIDAFIYLILDIKGRYLEGRYLEGRYAQISLTHVCGFADSIRTVHKMLRATEL